MKASVKRFLSALMVLALLLSMVSVTAFAAGMTTTVYCKTASGWTGCKAYWWGSATGTNPGWPGVAMSKDANGIWTYDVPSDAAGLIFTNGTGSQTKDLTVPTDSNVMYTYNTATWGPYDESEVEQAYFVAGTMNSWEPASADHKMIKQANGTYALTLTLEPGNHELKVTDGTWENSWGEAGTNQNFKFTAAEAGDFVVTFDGVGIVNVTGNLVEAEPMKIDFITVAGSEELVGAAWEPGYEAAVMEQNGQVYTLTLENVPAGEYEFKFTANGTWDIHWSASDLMVPGETYTAWFAPMGNSVIIVENEGATVTLTLDLTNMDPVTGNGGKTTVTVETPVAGVTVSGNVASGKDGIITIELIKDGAVAYTTTVDGETGDYSIANVAAGTYTLRVSKRNHVTREYELTVSADTTLDVKIDLIGDVNGDGRVNISDVARIYAHAKETSMLSDYLLAYADANGDGEVNVGDAARLYAHIKKTSVLW